MWKVVKEYLDGQWVHEITKRYPTRSSESVMLILEASFRLGLLTSKGGGRAVEGEGTLFPNASGL